MSQHINQNIDQHSLENQNKFDYRFLKSILFFIVLLVLGTSFLSQKKTATPQLIEPIQQLSSVEAIKAFKQLPLSFEKNQGQGDENTVFLTHGLGYSVEIKPQSVVFNLANQRQSNTLNSTRVSMHFADSLAFPVLSAQQILPGQINYLTGRDMTRWKTHIPTYREVVAQQIYPGIDVRYYGNQNQLEYDFIVHPGADFKEIRLAFSNINDIVLDEDGQLLIETAAGVLIQKHLMIFQEIEGKKVVVKGQYQIFETEDHLSKYVGFAIGDYDKHRTLIIDPVLDFSTYLGGNGREKGLALAIDAQGNAYVAGVTTSRDFPIQAGFKDNLPRQINDAFLLKINPQGDTLLFSTYFGGTDDESDTKFAIDDTGNLYLTGTTTSKRDFPLKNPVQSEFGGGPSDAYVAKLNTDGSELLFSSYLGGKKEDVGRGITVNKNGDPYVIGATLSDDFPILNAFQDTFNGKSDIFLTHLSTDNARIFFSTYIGGQDTVKKDKYEEVANAISLDENENIYLAGYTYSEDFPTTPEAVQHQLIGKKLEGFVLKLNQDASEIEYGTFLGGSEADEIKGLVVSSDGIVTVAGNTQSEQDFPITDGSFQQDFGGGKADGFITRLNSEGTVFIFSTFLGGDKEENLTGLSIGVNQTIWVAGDTRSKDFPLINPLQDNLDGNLDGIITQFDENANDLIFSTFLGGSKTDTIKAIASDQQGNIYITGSTTSKQLFPLLVPIQASFGGSADDAFIAKLFDQPLNTNPVITSEPLITAQIGDSYEYQVIAEDSDGDTLSFSLSTAPVEMTINNTGLISFSPVESGDFAVTVVVQDGKGGQDIQSFTLSVPQPQNQAPNITSVPLTAGQIGALYQYQVTAEDADGDSLTFFLSAAPAGMAINDAGLITFTPTITGDFPVTIQVNDGKGGQDSQAYILIILEAENQPPVITSVPITSTRINENYQYQVVAEDADGDPLIFSLSTAPAGMEISATGLISFSATETGDFPVTAQVRDGKGGVESQSYILSVSSGQGQNQPPAISSSPITTATVDNTYQYQLIATDPDNDPLNYVFTEAPLGMSIGDTGLISWVPRNSGTFSINVTVSDGQGGQANQTYELVVNFGTNEPPQLNSIGNQTAPLGTTLNLQFTANTNAVTFIVEPMPLPEGMTLNSATGLLQFSPTQPGNHILTIIASDGRFEDSETITITVPPADGVTRLTGRVLTTNAAPLPNVRLEIAGIETLTDNNGNYLLDNLPVSGDVRLLVDGSTVNQSLGAFATVPEIIHLIDGANNILEPAIILLPLDIASADPVNPNTTSIITSSRFTEGLQLFEPTTLTIPPGAAIDDETGQPYVGDIHISRVADPTQGPRPLPADIGLSAYIAIQPFGVTYPNPVPISFPNLEGFPPGSRMDFFALNHETGAFEKIGEGLVSSDGQTVDSIGGVVKSNSWHGIVPQRPQAAPSQPPNQSEPAPDTSNDPEGDPGCGKDCNKECDGCSFDKQTGNLSEYHSLPNYYSLQKARTIRLEYNSNLANVKPVIPMVSGFGNQAPPPKSMSLEINVGGVKFGEKKFSEVRVEPSGVFGQFKTTRPAFQFDSSSLKTGIHDYQITVECQFPISFRSDTVPGQLIVDNRKNSPFGAGWSLAGLQHLYEHSDGKVLLTTGTATSLIYTPINGTDYSSPPGDFTTLQKQANGQFIRRMRTGTQYLFDTDGRQIQKLDRNGNSTQYRYDGQGRIERIIDPVLKEYVFSYFAGRIDSISDPLGRTTRFKHDSEGNLTKIIEPNQDDREFEYETGSHLMKAQLDQRDNRKEYFYDFADKIKEALLPDGSRPRVNVSDVKGLIDPNQPATRDNPAPAPLLTEEVENSYLDLNGNESKIKSDVRNMPLRYQDGVGRVTEFQRDADSNLRQTKRPNQSIIVRTFNNTGKALTRREEFNGAIYRYTYDALSLPTSFTNPNNHLLTINRDTQGNPEEVINHIGHTATMSYDTRGLVQQMVNPNGLVTNYTYNAQGLVETITETPPAGSTSNVRVTSYSYDDAGQNTKIVTPDNIVLEMVYDSKGLLRSVTDNLNQSIEYTYDSHNNLIQTDTLNTNGDLALTVSNTFDKRNRLETVSTPHSATENSVVQYLLDNNSNVSNLIDPNQAMSKNMFDEEDRLIENTHRLNGITTYKYDTNDRITEVTAPNGVVTKYTYDVLGRRETETSPDRGTLTYTYDLANNVKTITDGRGITVTMAYDELERIKTKTYPNTITGKNENVTYIYDNCPFGIGRLCARIDESGEYAYEYDIYGNIVNITHTELGIPYTHQYSYDDGDNVIQATYPSGRVVNYSRDGVRRISAIDASINAVSQSITSDITYRADNRMTSCTFGNGLTDERRYDLQGRLTSQVLSKSLGEIIDERTYSYDANSNILNRTTTPQLSNYKYDALDRLTADNIDNAGDIEFDYDLNGNRLSRLKQDDINDIYTYQNNSNRLLNQSTVITGSLLPTPDERQLVFNDANRLFQVIDDGQLKAEYIYNDQGQRTRKIIHNTDNTTQTIIFHYDLMGYLISETDELGTLIRDYLWMEGGYPLAQIDQVGVSERLSYLHNDHLMTNRLATNSAQNVVWRWEGAAFGETPANNTNTIQLNLRFPGQYIDTETNLHYNWNRYYDPTLGRYITSDSIGLSAGLNAYSYVLNNPIMYIDPFGFDTLIIDSRKGTVTHKDDEGKKVGVYPYTSGRDGITDTSVSNKGPIPQGDYTLNPSEISKGGWLRNLLGDWGKYRAPLHPNDGTKTFGRDGFFIHGGKNPGSAGCIDVGSNDSKILGPNSPIGSHKGPVSVKIK